MATASQTSGPKMPCPACRRIVSPYRVDQDPRGTDATYRCRCGKVWTRWHEPRRKRRAG
jgi:hypothetical protein